PELILESASIVDRSSNYFYGITAFQYSFWSWDWHMCQLLLSICDDVGIIKQQLEDMHVNYSFRWHGKQFDWLPYFVSMDMYLTNNNIKKSAVMPVQCGVDSLDYYRLFLSYGDVSLEKSKLPINIVQELYRDFSEIYKAENISEKKRNSNFNLKESVNTKILLEYSVTKGYYYGPPQSKDFYFFGDVVKPPYPGYAKKEYEYMKKLYEVRVEQFSCLETLLLSDAMDCPYAPVKIN
ncbi:MAG: hypothetical protein HON55_03315, partial [Legionellales bacterium]|nr:hypothetical protein [Legionellales bacterium]